MSSNRDSVNRDSAAEEKTTHARSDVDDDPETKPLEAEEAALDSSVIEEGFVDVAKRYFGGNDDHDEKLQSEEEPQLQRAISEQKQPEQKSESEAKNPSDSNNKNNDNANAAAAGDAVAAAELGADFTVIEKDLGSSHNLNPTNLAAAAVSDASSSSFSSATAAANEPQVEGDASASATVELPPKFAKRLVCLQCDSYAPDEYSGGLCDVYLVGTVHVSLESCEEVKAVIRYIKPQVVFLELCEKRTSILVTPTDLQVPSFSEMVDMWRKQNMNAFGILYYWFLAKVAKKLEVVPGSEFRCAYETAIEQGARVVLGDRPVQITLRRAWAKMNLWYKLKFLFCMVFQAFFLPSSEEIEKLMHDAQDADADALTLMVQKSFPTLIETILYERDLYMASKLLQIARDSTSVVAVVGRGHLAGIEKNWNKPVSVDSLLEIPLSKSSTSSLKFWTKMSLAIGAIAISTGLYLARKK